MWNDVGTATITPQVPHSTRFARKIPGGEGGGVPHKCRSLARNGLLDCKETQYIHANKSFTIIKSSVYTGDMDITLRDYQPGDWEAMYALDLACFEPQFRFTRGVMRGFAEAPSALSILAEAAGELVGFCVVQMDGKLGYVVTLDVAAAWRRLGLAQRMMEAMETKVRAAGGVGMALHVFTGNEGAMRFYESIAYGRTGRAEDFYGKGLDALVYRKRFQP